MSRLKPLSLLAALGRPVRILRGLHVFCAWKLGLDFCPWTLGLDSCAWTLELELVRALQQHRRFPCCRLGMHFVGLNVLKWD
jgi:hypothetical protein